MRGRKSESGSDRDRLAPLTVISGSDLITQQSFKVVLVRNHRKGKRFAVEERLSINGRKIDDAAWFASERECHFEGMYEAKQDGLYKLPLVFAPQVSTYVKRSGRRLRHVGGDGG